MSPDDRGIYNWSEVSVGTRQQRNCFYEPQHKVGMVQRLCASHHTWESPIEGSMLSYDGSMCITYDTFRLREISRVCSNNLAYRIVYIHVLIISRWVR